MRAFSTICLTLILATVTTNNGFSACNVIGDKMYGDCSNVTVNTRPKKPIKVKEFRDEGGIISGATIFAGGHLELSGISEGTITVNKGGKLALTGQADSIINYGSVDIEGQVGHLHNLGSASIGGVVDSLSGKGKVTYRSGAVVGGVPH
jgi:hypothetical protein